MKPTHREVIFGVFIRVITLWKPNSTANPADRKADKAEGSVGMWGESSEEWFLQEVPIDSLPAQETQSQVGSHTEAAHSRPPALEPDH